MTQTKYIVTVDGERVGPECDSMTGAILIGFRLLGDTDKDLEKWDIKEIQVPVTRFSPEMEKAIQDTYREFDEQLRNGDICLDFSGCRSIDEVADIITQAIEKRP